MSNTKKIVWIKLFVWILGVELVGVLGGLATASSVSGWYQYLEKPCFSPPNWIFGPVWTVLYLMIGYVGYVLWKEDSLKTTEVRRLFLTQILLNACWSPVFFGLRSPGFGLIIIVGLFVLIGKLIRNLWQINRVAAWLLIPYWAWVGFASLLNLGVWWLN